MKRALSLTIGAALIIAALVAIILVINNSKDHNSAKKTTADTNATVNEKKPTYKTACAIFSLADAKQLLGDTAKGGATNNQTSSDDLAVSSCSYSQDAGANVPISSSNKSASLLVRAPKTSAGNRSNQNEFGPLKPAEAQPVNGYGDSAYWDAQYGQLNILKNNTWYILSYGPITPASRTLGQTQQLADILISKM